VSAQDGRDLLRATLTGLIKLVYDENPSDLPLNEIAAPWSADLTDEEVHVVGQLDAGAAEFLNGWSDESLLEEVQVEPIEMIEARPRDGAS